MENHQDDIFPQLSESSFRAFHQWTRSADQGSSLSKIRLGDYSYYGIGRSVDYDRAVDEYREAAKDQNPQAKFNMGFMYERGLGVAKVILNNKELLIYRTTPFNVISGLEKPFLHQKLTFAKPGLILKKVLADISKPE